MNKYLTLLRTPSWLDFSVPAVNGSGLFTMLTFADRCNTFSTFRLLKPCFCMNVSANSTIFTFQVCAFKKRHASLMHRCKGFDTFTFCCLFSICDFFAIAFTYVKHNTKRNMQFFAFNFAMRRNRIYICKTQ